MAAELDPILNLIAADDATLEIAAALSERGARLRVAPLIGAARTALLAAVTAHTDAPLLYIVTTAEAAIRAHADLCAWLGSDAALLFPSADALPYEHISPGPDIIGARLRVVARLQGSIPSVIVAPVRALIQPTIAPDEWASASLNLAPGEQRDLDELLHELLRIGYRLAPTVEEPGEVNRRGGILDVFPTGDQLPLRIEFFGDEVDSLRRFDPVTQRSQSREQRVTIGPANEIPLWNRERALQAIGALDTADLRPEARSEWDTALERLTAGERFEGRAFYAPFFRGPRPATLLEHLPPGAAVALSEATLLAQHAAELQRQFDEQRSSRISGGELPPDFPEPYLRWEALLARADGLALADLSNNDGRPDFTTEGAEGAERARKLIAGQWSVVVPPSFVVPELFGGQLRRLVDDIAGRLQAGERVSVVTTQAARIDELVRERRGTAQGAEGLAAGTIEQQTEPDGLFLAAHGALDQGFRAPDLGLTVYTDAEIFGWRERRPVAERKRKADKSAEERAAFLRGLKPGDYVVHIEHGIAQFDGMVRRSVAGVEREYLNLRYAEGDRLYVPIDQVDRISRYIGAGDSAPSLTRLGTQEWERTKRKVRQAVQELAGELLELYARRQLSQGHAFAPDGEWQRELEASFPYSETDDQLRAIEAVKADMEAQQPMDRLICGDVGFGKTEVALRAAFKAVQDGRQVAILVPTTVLAQQHYETFSKRMAAFPIAVEQISRFRSTKEQAEILNRLAKGEVDIIVGTHRLLSKDVVFKDLGLLIVDEEQRFGVRHKERIKTMRANVDVLTLTATPIPRTLHMALAGIRDMSVIDTPPQDRLPVKTYLLPYDERTVREAVLREVDRGGQVFFLHNRVASIYYVAGRLKQLVPEVEIGVGHGQMDEKELEQVMLDFFTGKTDVLVSTTIIENGLDVPNANTIIIDDATHYGLAQLYQLRGRVGRSTQRAYAYLFYPADRRLTGEAQERLLAIQEATELGAGLRIAMRDLEIRGAGNLLGAEQSGNIAAVGFDLYSRLLQQAVGSIKREFDAGRDGVGAGVGGGAKHSQSTDRGVVADASQANASPVPPPARRPVIKVDEKVLLSPLVTLDLPLDAYLPAEYISDDRVRLEVYQRLAAAQTPVQVRNLRSELRDRFGEPPLPAEHLLTWLLIKALALKAGVTSIVTTDDEFVIRLPDGLHDSYRDRLRRRYVRDAAVKIGPQFVRLDRRSLNYLGGTEWIAALTGVLETAAGGGADPPPLPAASAPNRARR